MDQTKWFLQEDLLNIVRGQLGEEQWITAYELISNPGVEDILYYCIFIPNEDIDQVLGKDEFDVSYPYFGYPSIETDYETGAEAVYSRYGGFTDFEPIVFVRNFHEVKPEYLEVSQEFVHFFNLYFDRVGNKFILIHDDGTEEDIVKIEANKILIRSRQIKQFLAFKEMSLVILFEFTRFASGRLSEIGLKDEGENWRERGERYYFSFLYSDIGMPFGNAFSRLLGKKVVRGMRKETTGIYPYEKEKSFQEFIIDQDENGTNHLFTCDPGKAWKFLWKKPRCPFICNPRFLQKRSAAEVL